jgi:hypothetical protein
VPGPFIITPAQALSPWQSTAHPAALHVIGPHCVFAVHATLQSGPEHVTALHAPFPLHLISQADSGGQLTTPQGSAAVH